MSLRSAIFSTTSLVFLATQAAADISANDIWSDWQAYMTGFGYNVTGQESMSGNTLTISELKMSAPIPEAEGDFELSLSGVDFVENGDGTVNLIFPETMPMTFVAHGPDGEAVSGALNYTMKNMQMRASGDPSKITYDYSADQIGMELTNLTVEGEDFPSDALSITLKANGLNGQSVMEPGALRKIAQNMALGATEYAISFDAPGSEEGMKLNGSMATLSFAGDTFLPASFDQSNPAAAFENGFAVNGSFSYTGSETSFSILADGDDMAGSSSAEMANLAVAMDKDALSYTVSSTGVNFNLIGNQVPLPIVAGLGELAFNILIPISKSETSSDFPCWTQLKCCRATLLRSLSILLEKPKCCSISSIQSKWQRLKTGT